MLTEAAQTKSGPIRGEPAPRILIGDDQPDVLEALRLLLKPEGYLIDTASSPQQLLRAMELKDYDVVLMDLNYTRDTTSGEEGLDLLQRIHTADESLPVVVMTAWGSVNVAVEAMRRGARDFIQKPWENERLLSIIRTQTELGRAIRRGRQLEAANQALMADGHSPLLAESADAPTQLIWHSVKLLHACQLHKEGQKARASELMDQVLADYVTANTPINVAVRRGAESDAVRTCSRVRN